LGADAEKNARQIDVDNSLPLFDREVGGERGIASDASIVAGNIQPAERIAGGCDESLVIIGAAGIRVPIKRAATALFDPTHGGYPLHVVNVGDYDACALACVGERDRSPDSTRTTGNECRFSG
jgi:hypothetical protein